MRHFLIYIVLLPFFIVSCQQEDFIEAPTIKTLDITDITDSSAKGGGHIISDGGSKITEKGLSWNTSNTPTILNFCTKEGVGNNNFTSNISNLLPNTKYYVRAYAVNKINISYGNTVQFTTLGQVPTIALPEIIDTSYFYAKCQSTLISNGGFTITQMGFCWSKNDEPTLNNSYTISNSLSNSFSGGLINLESNTTYFVRAFAQTDLGINYSNSISFTTKQLGNIVDIDGNTYRTIEVNNKIWMIDNLKTTHFRNGSAIAEVVDNDEWKKVKSSAFCNYNNDENIANNYGLLYNWYAVNDINGICPTGWHAPDELEWKDFVDYFGGDNLAGGKMKSLLTEPLPEPRWLSPNTGATNESGFSGLPGGVRNQNGVFEYIGQYGFWWNSTEKNPVQSGYQILRFNSTATESAEILKSYGMAVRCVKN